MKASCPGEFIHMIIVELSTLKDGKVIMFISVDNFSRYCFSNAVTSPLTFEKLTNHLDSIIDDLKKHHAALMPLFIMGYAQDMQFKLELRYKGRAHFQFSETLAEEIAQPVARDLLNHLNRRHNN